MDTIVKDERPSRGGQSASLAGRVANLARRMPSFGVSLAGVIIIAIMLLNAADTFFRYVLSRPLNWAYDLSEALLVGLVFFSLARVTGERTHIRFELFYERLSGRALRLADVIYALSGLFFLGFIAYSAAKLSYFSWLVGSLQGQLISIPRWIPMLVVVLGTFACCLHLLSLPRRSVAPVDEAAVAIPKVV